MRSAGFRASLERAFLGVVLCAGSCIDLGAQIMQNHPELCGDSSKAVAVPPGMSAAIDRNNGRATLTFPSGHSIVLDGINSTIHQVCPVSDHLIVVFGFNDVGYEINLADPAGAVLLDSFRAYDPMMSPDQHWIVSRHFYAPQSQIVVSEEYLLYDLTISKALNRRITDPRIDAVGWAMYPAVPNSIPTDRLDVPDSQKHVWPSRRFFWASDSGSVIFADRAQGKVSLVIGRVSTDGPPTAYVHAYSGGDACRDESTGWPLLDDAQLSGSGPSVTVRAAFVDSSGNRCESNPGWLSLNDFEPAHPEVYPRRTLKKSVPAAPK